MKRAMSKKETNEVIIGITTEGEALTERNNVECILSNTQWYE